LQAEEGERAVILAWAAGAGFPSIFAQHYRDQLIRQRQDKLRQMVMIHLGGGRQPKKSRAAKLKKTQQFKTEYASRSHSDPTLAALKGVERYDDLALVVGEAALEQVYTAAAVKWMKANHQRECQSYNNARSKRNRKEKELLHLDWNQILPALADSAYALLMADVERYFAAARSLACLVNDTSGLHEVRISSKNGDVYFKKAFDRKGRMRLTNLLYLLGLRQRDSLWTVYGKKAAVKRFPVLDTMTRGRPLVEHPDPDTQEWFQNRVLAAVTKELVRQLMQKNPRLAPITEDYRQKLLARQQMHTNLLTSIPARYIDLYPIARSQKRHFILHVGPTNSGKTYAAIKAMEEAQDGIYLAPLRLLAYEQYETLNRDGCPCTMITGEETLAVEGSTFQSSTVEVADLTIHYDVAVIDEAQMIANQFRGGAWTRAILGLWADEIHVCLAPEAEELVCKLIDECGDSRETVYHRRFTPLIYDKTYQEDSFPDSVEPGDAYIVFTRNNVHACAAELQARGVKCSVIYGALPYDVRRREAEKFASGENPVLVATDAIGMGLNLPIRRVIILEVEKFDGFRRRWLKAGEVKQIIGRAGRYGIYSRGYYSAAVKQAMIHAQAEQELEPLQKAQISFPESLLGVEGPLSELLETWNRIPVPDGFHSCDLQLEISLAKELELISDNKELIYTFVFIPFPERNKEVKTLWKQLFEDTAAGAIVDPIPLLRWDLVETSGEMNDLEAEYKRADLLYHYGQKFAEGKYERELLHYKSVISKRIIALLESQTLKAKKCRRCGKVLPWNYPYLDCYDCYQGEGQFFDGGMK
jgi:ATP-dependent RNA helicase SUPV3L1/SUV3